MAATPVRPPHRLRHGTVDLTPGRSPRVLDAFQVVKLGSTVVDQVPRRVQQRTLGHRGFAGDPRYSVRRLLLRRGAPHSKGGARLTAAPEAGEAMNLPIEKIWLVGQGYRNFDNYRLRLLLYCGDVQHTPATPRIRESRTRLVRRAGSRKGHPQIRLAAITLLLAVIPLRPVVPGGG